MRRAVFLITLVFATSLVVSASAFGIKAGFNLATKRLEAAYKIALFERRFNPDGCYPAPSKLAKDDPQDPRASARWASRRTPAASGTSTRSTS